MKKSPSPRISKLAAAILFAIALPGNSQTLDAVVVSASRTEQASFDAPGSIQSVNRDVIESAGPQINISEALAGVPGINVANRNNYSQDLQVSIRGFGSRAPFGVRGVRLLIDGIPQTLPDGQGQSSQFALTSADRIEVLKGPVSLLYGNAAGGVVQVFTRSAGDKPEFSAVGYAGSDDLYRSSLQYSEKKGPYGLVVDYAYMSSDGFRDYSKARRDHFNSKLEHVTEHGKTTFVANILKNDSEEPGSLTADEYASNPHQARSDNINQKFGKQFTQGMLGVSGDRKLNSNSQLDYRAYFGVRNLDNPLSCPNFTNCTSGTINRTGYSMIERTFYGAATSLTRRDAFNGIPVQYTGGIDLDYVIDKRTAKQNVAGIPTGDLGRDEDNIAYNTDAFVQSQWFFNEKYTGLLGARLSRVTLKVEDQFPVSGSNPDSSGRKTYTGISPVLGLTRHHSSSLNTYVQYGRGFETPTLNEVLYSPPGGSSANKFYSAIDPAKSNQIEIGFKWRPTASTKIDGALFAAKTKDDIVPDSVSTSGSTWQNADTFRQGVEISALALLSKSIVLRLAYTAIDAEYTSNGSASSSRVQDGKNMPGIPKYRIFGDLTWRSIGWTSKPNSAFSEAGIEIAATGKTWVDSSNIDTQADSYELLNLKASHHIKIGAGTLGFIARLDNIADTKYVGSVISDRENKFYYEPGAPRNWLLGLKYTVQM
ncbi:TonB-dependent receptor [beta proteobacterium MWH-UniP1]